MPSLRQTSATYSASVSRTAFYLFTSPTLNCDPAFSGLTVQIIPLTGITGRPVLKPGHLLQLESRTPLTGAPELG